MPCCYMGCRDLYLFTLLLPVNKCLWSRVYLSFKGRQTTKIRPEEPSTGNAYWHITQAYEANALIYNLCFSTEVSWKHILGLV